MKKVFFIVFITVSFYGCELFKIGKEPSVYIVEINQSTPLGTIYLFLVELDSNNVKAATRLIAQPSGKHLLAIDKYDLYDEMFRLRRVLNRMPVTYIIADTLSDNNHKIQIEFDYIRTYSFLTKKIKEDWYIVEYSPAKK